MRRGMPLSIGVVALVMALFAGALPAAETRESAELAAQRKEMKHRERRIIYNNDGCDIFPDEARTPKGFLAYCESTSTKTGIFPFGVRGEAPSPRLTDSIGRSAPAAPPSTSPGNATPPKHSDRITPTPAGDTTNRINILLMVARSPFLPNRIRSLFYWRLAVRKRQAGHGPRDGIRFPRASPCATACR